MAIEFKCPNGHKLKVKDTSAGKTGRCPVCNALVRVPVPHGASLSEDAILGILGPAAPSGPAEPPAEGFADGFSGTPERMAPKRKSCPQCHAEIEQETHICPQCRTYIAGLKDF
jgi:hypothetical protein